MTNDTDRQPWRPDPELETTRQSLDAVRQAMIDCLVESRGGPREKQARYLEGVLERAGGGALAWADFYRALTVLKKDALAEGADPRLVREHLTRLQRLLEQVQD